MLFRQNNIVFISINFQPKPAFAYLLRKDIKLLTLVLRAQNGFQWLGTVVNITE